MLVFVRASRYDAGTGQFTQQDPIGIAGGANVYGFAGGDPVNFSDPFGLCPKGEICRRYVFAHLSSTSVAKGGVVGAGTQIAETGNSGRSTGPHLHYEEGTVGKSGKYTADLSGDVSCPLADCSNVSSRPAGMRTTTVDGEAVTRAHNGTDYTTATGAAVFAPAGGDVVREGYQDKTSPRKGYGLRIVIDVVIPQPKP